MALGRTLTACFDTGSGLAGLGLDAYAFGLSKEFKALTAIG